MAAPSWRPGGRLTERAVRGRCWWARPARGGGYSGDGVAWERIVSVCFLGLMSYCHGTGGRHGGELGQGYTEPLCTTFVTFCVSVIISHQVFKKGGGALYGM